MAELYSDHVELYDIAFDWDVGEEVDWLVDRLCAPTVLEPGCGSGRMLEALAQRGIEVFGIDRSDAMVAFARRRLGRSDPVVVADMTDFDLGRKFAGAIGPINTLLHLRPEELTRHLESMGRHLELGGRYLVQVGLVKPDQRSRGRRLG